MRSTIWAIFLLGCTTEVVLQEDDKDTEPTDTTATGTETDTETTETETETSSTSTSTSGTSTTTTSTGTSTSGTVPLPPCVGGSSWRDALPPLPAPVGVPATLDAGTGVVGSCEGDPTITTDPALTEFVSTAQAHNGGLWYFEAKTSVYTSGWSNVSVYAWPSEDYNGSSFYGEPWASADHQPPGEGVVSVAVDLDAGHAWFFEDGALASDEVLSLDPGVGAFRAHVTSMVGNEIELNLGADPFVYDPPPGFQAWSSDASGGGGACASDGDIPAPVAPITVAGTSGYPATTFLSDATDPTELVLLGVYEPTAANGVIQVNVNRTTPVTLALASYEPVDWTIVPGAGANIVSIVVFGYENQRVSGAPVGTPVSILTAAGGMYSPGVGIYQWPYDTGGNASQTFVSYVEERLCLPLEMFGGAYSAGSFTVD